MLVAWRGGRGCHYGAELRPINKPKVQMKEEERLRIKKEIIRSSVLILLLIISKKNMELFELFVSFSNRNAPCSDEWQNYVD
ncbi:hypothetical protein AsAng_0059970 [Aureispira anguillae]|uniref:Uncharacterized protein n=1 Tax=Aureispira anguillae TaxID=2864201 RepID=A0A915YLZ3_9BACT|nr:hypothetical protein AsAng_0059970 [Aureispira anguillae]